MAFHRIREILAVLRRKAGAWRRMPLAEKLWFAPAYLLLGLMRLVLMAVPFRWIAPLLGHGMQTAAVVPLASEREISRALHIGRAIRTAARYTPWDSKCLVQAMAARVLLGVNGLPYALFLGVNKDGESSMAAHAWVCTGPAAVTGGHSFAQFTVVGTFVSPTLAPPVQR